MTSGCLRTTAEAPGTTILRVRERERARARHERVKESEKSEGKGEGTRKRKRPGLVRLVFEREVEEKLFGRNVVLNK